MPGGMSTTLNSVPETRCSITSPPRIGRKRIDGVAFEDAELLDLAVVVVVAAGDTWVGSRDEDLPEVRRLQQLCQSAAGVTVLHEGVGEVCGRQVRGVGAEQPAGECVARVRDLEGLARGAKAPDALGQLAQRRGEDWADLAARQSPRAASRDASMSWATTSSM